MSLNHSVKLAIHNKFFLSLLKMPKAIQKASLEFLKKFKENPTHKSINYEPINTFKDPQLKTCRINKAYRVIVRAPEVGNTYLILWVDHHDEAMNWAKNKVLNINEHTNAIEVYDLTILEANIAELEHKASPKKLFKDYSDDQLTALGVSAPILQLIKLIDSDEALAGVQPLIPAQIYSYLSLLQAECTYDEVLELALSERQEIPDQELAPTIDEALELNQNKELFVVITDDEELELYLNAPSEQWRIFLHPNQRAIVEASVKGSVRVLGGAGTGKTVVAMHRVKWLIENVLKEGEQVLFTTYTKTLTNDLETNLKLLLTPSQLERVTITNLDKLVHELITKCSSYQVAYSFAQQEELKRVWEQAIQNKPAELSDAFMRMEWEQVILAQGISTLKGYLKALRKGRGKAVKAAQRKLIWACFQRYIDSVLELKLIEPDMAMWELTRMSLDGEVNFPYRAVVLDELQDMSTAALRLLRVLTPMADNDLFLVGDGHQKIYPRPLAMNSTGIKIQGKGHAHRLRINYRTTQEIHKRAMTVLKEGAVQDIDGEPSALKMYQSLTNGEYPEIHHGGTQTERDQALKTWLSNTQDSDSPEDASKELCVVVRSKSQREAICSKLKGWGIDCLEVLSSTKLTSDLKGVRVMTAHRIKGLEFKGVALVDWDSNFEPMFADQSGDSEYTAQLKKEQRSLAYVAMSRARLSLFVSYM